MFSSGSIPNQPGMPLRNNLFQEPETDHSDFALNNDDEFMNDDDDDDASFQSTLISKVSSETNARRAGDGPGLLIVQVTNLEISQNGQRQTLRPRSISLSVNDPRGGEKTEEEGEVANRANGTDSAVGMKLPSDITTSSPSKFNRQNSPAKTPGRVVGTTMEIELNEDIRTQGRPISLPLPHSASGSSARTMSISVKASHGLALYNSSVDVLTALSAPGIELEEWTQLTPITEPLSGLQPGDTPFKANPSSASLRPAFGRARILTRYVPHTSGVVTLVLKSLHLADYMARQSVSRDLFVRARVTPTQGGGNEGTVTWACSRLIRGVNTRRVGGGDIALGDEELTLEVNTAELHVRPEGGCPEVEFCVFDNKDEMVYNLIGKGSFPLAGPLCEGFSPTPNPPPPPPPPPLLAHPPHRHYII